MLALFVGACIVSCTGKTASQSDVQETTQTEAMQAEVDELVRQCTSEQLEKVDVLTKKLIVRFQESVTDEPQADFELRMRRRALLQIVKHIFLQGETPGDTIAGPLEGSYTIPDSLVDADGNVDMDKVMELRHEGKLKSIEFISNN